MAADPRRGRPPLEPDDSIRLTVRLTRAQSERLKEIARRKGSTPVAVVRHLIEWARMPRARG